MSANYVVLQAYTSLMDDPFVRKPNAVTAILDGICSGHGHGTGPLAMLKGEGKGGLFISSDGHRTVIGLDVAGVFM